MPIIKASDVPKSEEDYYGESDQGSSSPEASQRGATEGGETALIPKSLLMGKEVNPGDEVILKVVHIYEDEVEVQYPTGEAEEKKSPMMESEEMMDGMATEGEY